MHPCEIIYRFSGGTIYGEIEGTCRVLGKPAKGLKFDKWVRNTFTDLVSLYPGDIISNEALFCFDEASDIIMKKAGKDKPQRFRNYTHIVADDTWHLLTKGNKQEIYKLLVETEPEVCVISDSGQKHLLFKHKCGTWQFEDIHILPDVGKLKFIKETIDILLEGGFSKTEINSGLYNQFKILNFTIEEWRRLDALIATYRRSAIFDLALFLSKTKEKIDNDA
jgi:hypothetical protein